MLAVDAWGPAIFAVAVPILCAGVVLALRVAVRVGRTEQRVCELAKSITELRDDLRYADRGVHVVRPRGH